VDPVLVVEDALGDPQRWNRYGYARANGLRFTDPDGRWVAAVLRVAAPILAEGVLAAGAESVIKRLGSLVGRSEPQTTKEAGETFGKATLVEGLATLAGGPKLLQAVVRVSLAFVVEGFAQAGSAPDQGKLEMGAAGASSAAGEVAEAVTQTRISSRVAGPVTNAVTGAVVDVLMRPAHAPQAPRPPKRPELFEPE
jgi:hypothetical protein